MDRGKLHSRIQAIALALVLFTFPFWPLLFNNICIIIIALNWLAEGSLKTKFSSLTQRKIILLYAGLYLVFVLSYFLSLDKGRAAVVLEQNIFILLLPIILATTNFQVLQINNAFYSLSLGCLVGALVSLGNSLYMYSVTHETYHFFYHDLSTPVIGMHAVYFSLYIAFCLIFLITDVHEKWLTLTRWQRVLYFTWILFFIGFLILLSSKTLIIGTAIAINALFIMWLMRTPKLGRLVAIGIINITIIAAILKIDYVKARFVDSINSNIEFIQNDTYSELTVFTGITVRLTFWKFIIEILNEEKRWITGMSIGDGQNALHDKAVEKKLFAGNKERGWTDYTNYNAHNQFFQYLLLIGVVGMTYFIVLLAAIFWKGFQEKNTLLLLAMFLFVLFCFTESVLARNKGIVFFTIIPVLLLHPAYSAAKNRVQ